MSLYSLFLTLSRIEHFLFMSPHIFSVASLFVIEEKGSTPIIATLFILALRKLLDVSFKAVVTEPKVQREKK